MDMLGYAALKEGGSALVRVPIPQVEPYQALVRMRACGVCNGTDSKILHHTFKLFDQYPTLLGHEGVGEVVRLGEKARHLRVGDLVLLPFVEGTLAGYSSGWGAYCEYAVVCDGESMREDGLTPPDSAAAQSVLPRDMDPVEATMIVTFREVLSSLPRFGISGGERVVVYGAGPVGLSFVKFLKRRGCTVISVEVTKEKADRAKAFGADYAIDSTQTEVVPFVRALFPDGVEAVIDAVGVNSLINQAMELIANHGKICSYGISPKLNMNIDWSRAPYNWSVNFVQFPEKAEEAAMHQEVMEMIAQGDLVPRDFISLVLPLQEIQTAFDLVEQRKTDLKTVIEFNEMA